MPRVDLIHVSRFFFELNLLGIEVINDPKCLEKYSWKFRGLRDKNGGEKLRTPRYRGWSVAPPTTPKRQSLSVGPCGVTPARVPQVVL